MKPTAGRIVHYVSTHDIHRAAIINQVTDDGETVSLTVFNSTATAYKHRVKYDEGMVHGTWHWPEREE